ncbi:MULTISPECIES: hypothetical protein [unclassified Shewanella]|uniref:hypothetical protein n=1 Tax=unclassified Shewanella TaxID=196818 RepID=UPI001BBFDDFC|nr:MULTISPECIES: hypothetical protein [unclassified Shewanella]GIU07781.1 hypothetical protein TUM4444_07760 [Shewanella sp. MBTL60-112-B1]GIU30421.1 hypothetical protein TUM4445_13750 [Shewanella sp. MBTL60-112-B2]
MNIYLLIAGLLAALTAIGHFSYGRRHFLLPMKAADFDPVAKAVMHCVFHYVSVFLLLSSLILFCCAFEAISTMQSFGILLFIALNFGLFAIWQLYISFMSDIESPFKRLFQWVFFVLVAGFTLIGTLLS